MSVRRFSCRPVSVVLEATGFSDPRPMVWKRVAWMFGKLFRMYVFTASARLSDSVQVHGDRPGGVGVPLDAEVGVPERGHRLTERVEHEVGTGHDLVGARA